MRPGSVLARFSLVGAAALAAAGLAAGPALAADTPVGFSCQATPPIGGAQTFSLDAGVNGTAPATVAAGSAFTVTLAPGALTVPTSVSGYTVSSISGIKLSVPVPSGAALTGESLSGGSGAGSGASVAVQGGNVVVTVPGPVSGGATFTLPTLTLDLTAGASGGSVTTAIAGSGYANPGLTFNASVSVSFFKVNVPTACYAPASPALTTTAVD
ncbi:cyclase [Streptomyces sp. PTM05]|uniref:Cyclase n=1 Tax=Streptantibioticus parmotrematis TaxID=2873249 RepID=A0ABS7QQT7_9ACTN|nr:cyclase [Streptantibioticus parmotrematis]MBY8885563.1 cyclase [Streptantibioticus parmotrematis]